MQSVYGVDCDAFRKRNSGRKVEPTSFMDPHAQQQQPSTKPAIQTDAKPTAGARNKNGAFSRARGATAIIMYTELARYLQEHRALEDDQKTRFARVWKKKLVDTDRQLNNVTAQCESICFHHLYSYKQ